MLGRFFYPDGIDLVNLGDVRAFMLVNDNLYNICVKPSARQYSLQKHYDDIRDSGHQRSYASETVLAETNDPKFGLYLVLNHLIRHNVQFDFLDIGSFVGDVGLRYANFFRTHEISCHVHCFDPTLAGQLVPYNIELNGLGRHVTHHPAAVSGVNGCVLFLERRGHSDGSCASDVPGVSANSLVPSIRLSDFIRNHGIQNAFIKLDTENQESTILSEIDSFLQESINAVAFECHCRDNEVFQRIETISRTHALFDVGYVPKPFTFRHIPEGAAGVQSFRASVASRPYAYTDVLAVSKNTPELGALIRRLSVLETRPVAYSLIYERPA